LTSQKYKLYTNDDQELVLLFRVEGDTAHYLPIWPTEEINQEKTLSFQLIARNTTMVRTRRTNYADFNRRFPYEITGVHFDTEP